MRVLSLPNGIVEMQSRREQVGLAGVHVDSAIASALMHSECPEEVGLLESVRLTERLGELRMHLSERQVVSVRVEPLVVHPALEHHNTASRCGLAQLRHQTSAILDKEFRSDLQRVGAELEGHGERPGSKLKPTANECTDRQPHCCADHN